MGRYACVHVCVYIYTYDIIYIYTIVYIYVHKFMCRYAMLSSIRRQVETELLCEVRRLQTDNLNHEARVICVKGRTVLKGYTARRSVSLPTIP